MMVYLPHCFCFYLIVINIIEHVISLEQALINPDHNKQRKYLKRQKQLPLPLNKHSPPALPSVQLSPHEEEQLAPLRKIYGGKGDAAHLGGFTNKDKDGISYNLWNFMMGPLNILSIIDLGCNIIIMMIVKTCYNE